MLEYGGAGCVQAAMYTDISTKRWEYKVTSWRYSQQEYPQKDELNKLGADGWELVTSIASHRLIWKRPIGLAVVPQ